MLFGWFDSREAQAFGATLATTFIGRVPLASKQGERKFEAKAKAAIAQLGRMVADHKRQHRLNAYKKAKLGNKFKWTLKDAGYDAEYVDKLTDWLMLQL